MPEDFVVTPYEVKGEVDYERLTQEFGTQPLGEDLLRRLAQFTGALHPMLRRRIFFSHRDLDWIMDEYEKGNPFFLYTGRGPSGDVHLGHLVPWFFTQWLQEKFGVDLYFQMTDDEKFFHKDELSLEKAHSLAYENALDVIALGFKRGRTHIFSDVDYSRTLYPIAARVAKHVTFSTVKATFGLNSSNNIGLIFFTSMQAAPALLPSVLKGRNIPCLIPHAIDQDPHFRITRDVAPKLGYNKPASIHCSFLPSLQGPGKMSASQPETAIYTTDTPEDAGRKIMNAFTTGGNTVEEHRKFGGVPERCPVFLYYTYIFEGDDKALVERAHACRTGALLCGDDKRELAERVVAFLKEHQAKREEARAVLEQYLLKD
jgi:tryptophanyl-tRNA synthetase